MYCIRRRDWGDVYAFTMFTLIQCCDGQ